MNRISIVLGLATLLFSSPMNTLALDDDRKINESNKPDHLKTRLLRHDPIQAVERQLQKRKSSKSRKNSSEKSDSKKSAQTEVTQLEEKSFTSFVLSYDPNIFDIKNCGSYSDKWLFELSETCGENLNRCRCQSAKKLVETGQIKCTNDGNSPPMCPSDCVVCTTCLTLLGCNDR